ncbi:hypothetical protein [Blastococcus saxobsidens]|uniref:hypothetical protein n=1 Tax=Blastococcus saxobsidens TaxID=138336 RepID=UPI00140F9B08|nr:hypothetical protein [Blastococcus saxobsidens]
MQRLVLPVGPSPVQLSILVAYGALALLLLTGQARADRMRAELFMLAVALCLVATLTAAAMGSTPSLPSLGLLILLYLLWIYRVVPEATASLITVARGFVWMMLVFASVGIVQLVSQFVGVWSYTDYVGEFLPPVLIDDSFNSSIPVVYGSPVHKANAFVFLEPSFFSQFTALGAVVAVVTRAPAWQVLVLVGGVFSAVSGTGLIVLLVGGLLIAVRAGWLIRPVHVGALALAAVGLLASPVAPLLTRRMGETSQVGSSGYLRFVQPYAEVAGALREDPIRFLMGYGAGSVDRLLPSGREGREPVVYTIIPKLVFEYGLVAGGVLALFIVLVLLDRGAWRVVPGTVLVMIFLLSGSLLQPHTVVTAWLLTGLWAGGAGRRLDQLDRSRLLADEGTDRGVGLPAPRGRLLL